MHRVRMLLHFGIKPYLVFDGDYLPSKAETEVKRKLSRRESKARGLESLRLGRTAQAYMELKKAVDVTPEMAQMLMVELRRAKVDFIVAPYEADSQLVYLERSGIIDGILSEDSDLLVFGAQCLLTKLDQYGECVMINRRDFTACRDISLAGWTDEMFRRMAILSGCDYLQGLPKIGLKTAYRLVRKHKSLENIIRVLQLEGGSKVPNGYLSAYDQAEKTFLYQWVYCPLRNSVVHFTELPGHLQSTELPYIGKYVDDSTALGIASGDLNPHTKEAMQKATGIASYMKPVATKRTAFQTPLGKKNHTIETFFKAQRTPLAELDPNSFQPSPSQQDLLRDNPHRSWSADHAPSRIQLESNSNTQSASTGRRVVSGVPFSRKPVPYPFKRQKISSETEASLADGFTEPELEVSPFFQSGASAPTLESPSLGRAKAPPKERKDQPESLLRSDDSIEGALGEVFNVDDGIKSYSTMSKMKVYTDKQAGNESEDLDVTEVKSERLRHTASQKEGTQEPDEKELATFSTSESSTLDTDTQATSIFSGHVSAEIANLSSLYSNEKSTTLTRLSSTISERSAGKEVSGIQTRTDKAEEELGAEAEVITEANLRSPSVPTPSFIEVPVSSAPSPEVKKQDDRGLSEAIPRPRPQRELDFTEEEAEEQFVYVGETEDDDDEIVGNGVPLEAIAYGSNDRLRTEYEIEEVIESEEEIGEEKEEEDDDGEVRQKTPTDRVFSSFFYQQGNNTSPLNSTGSKMVSIPDSEDGTESRINTPAKSTTGTFPVGLDVEGVLHKGHEHETDYAENNNINANADSDDEDDTASVLKLSESPPKLDLSRFRFKACSSSST